jgi:predicted GNAT family acetyltransferase
MDVVNNAEKHRFEIELPDGAVAFADYRLMDGRVMFPHTVVPPAHEGQGLASMIARASLDWARSEGLKVIPACSFYRTYLQRHPEYQDLLHND